MQTHYHPCLFIQTQTKFCQKYVKRLDWLFSFLQIWNLPHWKINKYVYAQYRYTKLKEYQVYYNSLQALLKQPVPLSMLSFFVLLNFLTANLWVFAVTLNKQNIFSYILKKFLDMEERTSYFTNSCNEYVHL